MNSSSMGNQPRRTTIKNREGHKYELSEQTYVVRCNRYLGKSLTIAAGTRVRLISGVDGQSTPGYHFSKGWVTICRIEAEYAQFIGIEEEYLSPVG